MKKTLFILGLLLSFAFLYAQNLNNSREAIQYTPAHNRGGDVVLWDNTNINVNPQISGGTNTYWSATPENWIWAADDFEADLPWIIKTIYSKGFYPDPDANPTNKMGIVIWEHDPIGIPGKEIYKNLSIMVSNALEPVIVLPEPFQLPAPGHYWITICAVYDNHVCAVNADVRDYRWCIDRGETQIGHNYHYFDKLGLFAGYVPSTWTDASTHEAINPKLYSTYFLIEGEPGVDIVCDPVTNLKAEYKENCTKAELTWNAPSSGNFKYYILRDGYLIDSVETVSYTDVTFEATLEHNWDILVACDGYTPPTRVKLTNCKEPDCQLKPQFLTCEVEKLEDHCEALLKWEAPAEPLFKNTDPTNTGIDSYRCISSASGSILADDFVVPTGETWLITQVNGGGFYQTTLQHYDKPDYIGLEIFKDNGNQLPGQRIYEDPYQTPIMGSMQSTFTILLDPPLEITESGRYWVSFYGTYLGDEDEQKTRWLAYQTTVPKGAQWARYDYSIGAWETYNNGDYVSMTFDMLGVKTADPVKYNIYRDGVLIEENITNRSFLDTKYDPSKPHTWYVKSVCLTGNGVSAPAYVMKDFCMDVDPGEESISEHETTFTIFPNPTSNEITITAENHFNTIQVINFLGQTVISQSNIHSAHQTLDVSNLNAGVYFVRISSDNSASVQKFVKQ